MTTKVYQLPVDKTGWQTADKSGTAVFTWEYDDGREKLINLYAKGKKKQWDAASESTGPTTPDPENPLQVPDELVPIFGVPVWDRLTDRGEGQRPAPHGGLAVQPIPPRRAGSADLHGQDRPDGAGHRLEVLRRHPGDGRGPPRRDLLALSGQDRNGLSRSTSNLKSLLDDVLSDSRWDMTYLGMQILIEGLALAAFGLIRNIAGDPLGQGGQRLRHAGRGPSRHVRAPGPARLLPAADRSRARTSGRSSAPTPATGCGTAFSAEELWQRLGYDAEECIEYVKQSESQKTVPFVCCSRGSCRP